MRRALAIFATGLCAAAIALEPSALAQKSGGVLHVPHFDSPASVSLHEESTVAANRPGMGIFKRDWLARAPTRSSWLA